MDEIQLQSSITNIEDGDSGGIIYTFFVFIFVTLPSWFFFLVSFVTITLPTWIFTLLSWSFTLQLSFTSLLLLFGAFSIIAYTIIRYRILTIYSRLPKEAPQTTGASFDLHPGVVDDKEKILKNYPDELLSRFLEAIKVFGYLEKPVFHELARNLQTKRLVAGDTLDLEKERSFYIVVDGYVQVFVKTINEGDIAFDSFEGDDRGFQLLNEVGEGGTLSSLFTILSLFTDDIELRYDENESDLSSNKGKESEDNESSRTLTDDWSTIFSAPDANSDNNTDESRKGIKKNVSNGSNSDAPSNRTSWSNNGNRRPKLAQKLSLKENLVTTSVHPNIVVRATVDTTLAVIPAEAFHRLTEKFPKSVAHIMQVILTRFQRVTFWTGYKYLGLTKDLLRTEKLMNEMASYGLPSNFFKPGSMERLRRRFVGGVKTNDDPELSDSGLLFKNKKSKGANIRPGYHFAQETSTASNLPFTENSNKYANDKYLSPPMRTYVRPSTGSPLVGRDYDAQDDMYLRESVLECISKSIGLIQPAQKKASTFDPGSRHSSLDSSSAGYSQISGFNPISSVTSLLDIPDDESVAETISSITSEFDNDVEILFYAKGASLVKEGERNVGLFFVIDGLLDVSVSSTEKDFLGSSFTNISSVNQNGSSHKRKESNSNVVSNTDRTLFMIKPGGLAGYLAALTGFPSFVNIRASTNTYVGFLSKNSLNRLMEKNPNVLLTLAKRLISLLSPLVLQIDFALDWVQINAGQVLYSKGDPSDSIYIVLNGRVRAINEREKGAIDILGEYGQGQSVGELEVMIGSPRPYTLHAIRDTELARMPRTLFNALASRHPEITLQISRIIASRTRVQQEHEFDHGNTIAELGKNNMNLKTVGILPVDGSVPIDEFAEKLKNALARIDAKATLLNQATVVSILGRHAFSKIGRLKLISWLAEQEENVQIVLYLADGGPNSSWTQTCIRQADCILLVGLGDGDPAIGEYEHFLINAKTTARKELVLLHAERHCSPGTTRQWLKNRLWIHAHHHVQMALVQKPTMLREQSSQNALMNLRDHISKYYPKRIQKRSPTIYTGIRSDFSRLARRLCGKSVGLVLGGGGARGIAHIGVIRALEEAGIPIDMIGGTSIGSFVGGLYARDSDNVAILGRAKAFSSRMSSKWRQALDLTYPVTAWFTGHEFNRTIWKSFLDTQIEDFWLSYFCITTNITWSRMEVHQSGYAWRYVRASMSLASFLPPLCDNGHLLVDGGYMNNLPVSVMKSMGANTIFAVDVASHDDTSPVYYGDSISGWWVLLNRFNPFRRAPKIPSMADIQSRLAYVSSVKTLEDAKTIPGCLYMPMPVQQYATLEFSKFSEIFEVGYKAGKEMLKNFKEEGKLKSVLDEKAVGLKRGRIRRRNSM
ncbi:14430_t:CDS:2 [Ambispora leptoticha]|uniref:Lysophospholipase NTE1 n=1 Tax=Ambispora leptoticha TaxID=144679 RepID=A0A9N9BMS7_9GLOM|nr:14430_t:CDS:2 [Ambispora leptoticha]